MLAVVPFQNLSGDPAQDYFVDGMTEEMITQLGGLSPQSLGVIARTSSMQYKTTGKGVFVLAHFDHDWPGAEREFQHAIALNPSDPYSHFFYSNSLLSPEGRHDEAIAEMQSAISLDPYSFPFNSFFGRTLLWAGRPQEALTQLNKADQFRPNSAINHQRVSHVYASLGRYDEAISEKEKSRILNIADPETGVATARKLRAAYLKRGTRGYWEEELELTFTKDNPPEFYHGDYGRAIIYAQLGESRKAMEALNQAVAQHDMRLTELAMEPLFKPLCYDRAFSDLKKKIGVDTNSPAVAISSR
jgi:tetratricopeptide (TPR) repeat protein